MPVSSDRKRERGFAGLVELAAIDFEAAEPPPATATAPREALNRTDGSGRRGSVAPEKVSSVGSAPDAWPESAATRREPSGPVSSRGTSPATVPSNLRRNVALVCCGLAIAVMLTMSVVHHVNQTAPQPPFRIDFPTSKDGQPMIVFPPVSSPSQTQVEASPWKGDGSEEPSSRAGISGSGQAVKTDVPAESGEQASLDLLRLEDAKKVQQRLIALRYLAGPADGLWTSRCRSALREFKQANGLAGDDLFDVPTDDAVFSAGAVERAGVAPSGNKPTGAPEPEGRYPPPVGGSLNPLNTGDAMTVQKRLNQLGFFKGKISGVWGLISRSALRDFKVVNNLAPDDQWDSHTEQMLMADGSVRVSETFIGGWGEDQSDCGPTQPGGARLRINTRQAEIEDVICRFVTIAKEGSGWRVAADCAKPGKRWSSDVRIEASASRLTWTSNGETSAYLRCR
jgi:peptidoglycan hydrolase-like protein with peptidoglycan-binding domain